MKKLVLIMMMFCSLLNYTEENNKVRVEIEALIGVDKEEKLVIFTGGDINFGNLKNYSGIIEVTTFTMKDLGLENDQKKQVTIEYILSPLREVNGSYMIEVNQISPIYSIEVDNQGVTTELKLTLNREQANSSPTGIYEGSVTIKTIYTL